MTTNAPLEFFESHDPLLLSEYVELRRRVFRVHYPNLAADFGRHDENDNVSGIVLCRQEGCIRGGGRLTLSRPESPRQLPLEEGGSPLLQRSKLNEWKLAMQPYGEISRMAADDRSTRGLEISRGLARELCHLAGTLGVDVIFSICPEGPARLNRINSAKLGVTFHLIEKVPTEFGMEMWLCAYTGILKAYSTEFAA